MKLTHQTVIGENGKPEAAIIPWSVFLEVQSLLDEVDDGEATSEELEAAADRKAGNTDAFTDLEDIKAELSL